MSGIPNTHKERKRKRNKIIKDMFKKTSQKDSLLSQWLRLHFHCRGHRFNLVRELRSRMPCGMAKRVKQNRDESYLK